MTREVQHGHLTDVRSVGDQPFLVTHSCFFGYSVRETCYCHFMSYSFWLPVRDLLYAPCLKKIVHTVGFVRLAYFSFQPVLHDKGCGMCNPVCGMVHIKEPLLLIGKSSQCGRGGFPLCLCEWSFTICLTPYNLN